MEILSIKPSLLVWTIVCCIAISGIIYYVIKYMKEKQGRLSSGLIKKLIH